MPSEFDTLVQQLKLIQDGQPAADPLRKALSAASGAPMPRLPDLKHLGKRLDLMAKSLGALKVVPAPRRELTKGEQFLKSLASIKDGIKQGAADGSFSRVQTVELEARFNALVQQALQHLNAARR